jgi:hypothetical protein
MSTTWRLEADRLSRNCWSVRGNLRSVFGFFTDYQSWQEREGFGSAKLGHTSGVGGWAVSEFGTPPRLVQQASAMGTRLNFWALALE